jgi:hypothetical protein
MDATQARNHALVVALGVMATGVTYLLFQRLPDLIISGTYLRVNLGIIFMLLGSTLVTWVFSQEYWYEITAEFLLIYAATSVVTFTVLEFSVTPALAFVVIGGVGGLVSWGLGSWMSPVLSYLFTALLLTLSFAFVVVYLSASAVKSGNLNIVPPFLIFTSIFAVSAYGLQQEIRVTAP